MGKPCTTGPVLEIETTENRLRVWTRPGGGLALGVSPRVWGTEWGRESVVYLTDEQEAELRRWHTELLVRRER